MSVYLVCSMRGYKHPEFRDAILTEAMERVANEYGQAVQGIDWRRLDLMVAGAAFVDLTDIKGLHVGHFFRAKQVVDLWWSVKNRKFAPGRGYEQWVWQSVWEFVRISGTGGRAWRVMID